MIKKSMLFFIMAHLFYCVDKVEAGFGDDSHLVIDNNNNSFELHYLILFKRAYENVIELTIEHSFDKYIGILSECFPNVTKITFSECIMNDEIITYFAEQGKGTYEENKFDHLIDLDVSNKNISDIGAKAIAENLKKLVFLNIKGNQIECEGVLTLINNLPNLKYFSFDMDKMGGEQNQNTLRNLMAQKGIDVYHNYDYVG
jgi:Leucine-rich repeat (LRR) protein